ncbi:hypothetical protein E2C01_088770 [Portunus trituberculatus]|uniref:Uncharacterized protein n=1 Tax=Portunus trituberculatus TaxID=210409 RepID=A0A5B7JGD1_PORTR|nr:hypothetical protein [Portunus trituberculatus]
MASTYLPLGARDLLPLCNYQSLMGRPVCRVRPGQSLLYNCGFVAVRGMSAIISFRRGIYRHERVANSAGCEQIGG